MENREPKNRRTGTRRVNQEPRKGAEEQRSRGTEDIQEQSPITDLQSPISKATDNRQQTTDNKEQIGDLIYLANAEYPYPFPVTRPPHYWMTEQTGRLAEAVELYVGGDPLTPAALDLIRQYLRQYLERAVMTGDANRNVLIGKLATLRTAREIERFADELAEIGVEPF